MRFVGKILILTFNDTEEKAIEKTIAALADMIPLEAMQPSHSPALVFPGLEIRLHQHRVLKDGTDIYLTRLEYGALCYLAASYKGRNEYIDRLCRFPLLILDDFGMERGTEYGLEQVYNVVDSRYRSRKPLIVTTNLTLEELQHPEDTAHARIYDRLLEMCCPVCITGENIRKATAQGKMERLKGMMNGKESL